MALALLGWKAIEGYLPPSKPLHLIYTVIVYLLFIKKRCAAPQFACSHKLKINGYNCLNSINGRAVWFALNCVEKMKHNTNNVWIELFWSLKRFAETDCTIVSDVRYKIEQYRKWSLSNVLNEVAEEKCKLLFVEGIPFNLIDL